MLKLYIFKENKLYFKWLLIMKIFFDEFIIKFWGAGSVIFLSLLSFALEAFLHGIPSGHGTHKPVIVQRKYGH